MTLHIFNPDHDLALASHLANFTAPHAARALRSALGCLPAAWASEGDCVLVDDADHARKAYKRLTLRGLPKARGVEFVEADGLARLPIDGIEPWGWNSALRAFLLRHGVDKGLMPSLDALDDIRLLSHRATAAALLRELRSLDGTVGEAHECRSVEEIGDRLAAWGRVVLKAPWSSSGRGLRFVDRLGEPHLMGWLRNTLALQGCVMAEPYINKVKDFGMEFESDGEGRVSFVGLSLFSTVNGAYTGNVLATEAAKEKKLARYLPQGLLDSVRGSIEAWLGTRLGGKYRGPLGVDMMVATREGADGFLLHPCVEVNLRRTMGHAALAIAPTDDDIRRVMRIDMADPYMLIVRQLEGQWLT